VSSVYNYGSIAAADYGIDDYGGHMVILYNYGTINGVAAAICTNFDTVGHLYNYGTVDGAVDLGETGSYFVNSGSVQGAIALGAGAGEYVDSTDGSVNGAITCGSGGDVVIAGQTGGSVVGGSGNDVLYANPTQTAANNASKTTLDGGKGNNWLYGDGAYTTFDSGDNSAGTYNQIFGGQSEMADVAGYANNTVDYANLSSAYKSVDVNLSDGDAYMCSIADANGAPTSDYTFEDYLKNVPNVIGSSGSDVIICDDGVDTITHGSGAGDILYAGAGAGAGSQDTFVYTAMNESPLSNHDIIEGFKVGIDKLNFSQLDLPIADFLLSYGGAGSNTVYVEENPSAGFHSATDMIISIQASTSTALRYKDIIT
jgi:Peptidase M10 serralysin C terminal/RTX calcium-binding nonapeptide repeat (4 copies)